jgi:hypothetical protein
VGIQKPSIKGQEQTIIQNTTQKTKYWATQTPSKTGDELRCSGVLVVPAPHGLMASEYPLWYLQAFLSRLICHMAIQM